MSIPSQMNEEQLTHYLTIMTEKLLEKLQKNRPDLQVTPEQRKELAQNVAKVMMQRGQFSREDVIDNNPKFIQKLSIALVRTAVFGQHEFMIKNLNKLFNDNGVKNTDDMKNKLTPAELKLALGQMEKLHQEVNKALEETGLIQRTAPRPAPPAGPKPEPQVDDKMINLFGLLNSSQAGSIHVPVMVDQGNGLAIVDVNPNSETSYAQIDEVNKVGDKEFGDPLNLNGLAMKNYEAQGSPAVQETISRYTHDMAITPQLKAGG